MDEGEAESMGAGGGTAEEQQQQGQEPKTPDLVTQV